MISMPIQFCQNILSLLYSRLYMTALSEVAVGWSTREFESPS